MPSSDVTQLIQAVERGDQNAADELLPLVYKELRILAAAKLRYEKSGNTLQPTALVHEAYLRLVGAEGQTRSCRWDGRRHFFAAAAEAMRRILVDNARRKKTLRQGGQHGRHELTEGNLAIVDREAELLAIHLELDKLQELDATAADVVRLKYFAGMTTQEIAEVLGVSSRTVEYAWTYARAWLRTRIG
jgi:RNA polymerase sigma factor (TIGR02999 family)